MSRIPAGINKVKKDALSYARGTTVPASQVLDLTNLAS